MLLGTRASPESLAHAVGKPLDSEQDAGWLWAHQYRCTISHSENRLGYWLPGMYVRGVLSCTRTRYAVEQGRGLAAAATEVAARRGGGW